MNNEINKNFNIKFRDLIHTHQKALIVDFGEIKALLNEGADINNLDDVGRTWMHKTARIFKLDFILFVYNNGGNVNDVDEFGRSPLHEACAVNNPIVVDFLMDKDADSTIETFGNKQRAIHYAAKFDACDAVRVLVKHNVNFNSSFDYKHRTAIHLSAELGHKMVVRLMLEAKRPAKVNTYDSHGQSTISVIMANMPNIGYLALDQYYSKNILYRKQYFYISSLCAYPTDCEQSDCQQKTVLDVIVENEDLDLILHPVISKLIDIKWKIFGFKHATKMLSLNLIFAILWTIDPVITGMHRRHLYKFPIDIWRIFTFCGGVISVVIIIVLEIKSIKLSLNRRKNWRKWRLSEMNRDLIYCHPKYLDEELFIKHKISELKNMANMYLKDPCNFNRNILDWSVIVMIIVCSISHMVDVVHHSISIARFNLRFTSITIIMLWVRLMKYVKPYTVIGPFVVMLTLLLKDILKFFYLYMQFYIPYACAFWMLFGGSKVYEKYIYIQPNTPDQITQIPGWETPGIALWTLFRITLVDEYSFEDLASLDSVMALLMIFTWIMISGVLILNLFIALMSDSFQRIHDNAHAVAKMQQAILLSDIENNFQNDREKLEYSNIMKTEYSDISTTYNEEEIDIQKEMRDSILQLQYELSDLTKFVKEHIKT